MGLTCVIMVTDVSKRNGMAIAFIPGRGGQQRCCFRIRSHEDFSHKYETLLLRSSGFVLPIMAYDPPPNSHGAAALVRVVRLHETRDSDEFLFGQHVVAPQKRISNKRQSQKVPAHPDALQP